MADVGNDSAFTDRIGPDPVAGRSTIKWVRDGFNYEDSRKFSRPFHTFLVKVASLCNLNCSYCYVYQSPDDSWKSKPKFLEPETAHYIAVAIQQHVDAHEPP